MAGKEPALGRLMFVTVKPGSGEGTPGVGSRGPRTEPASLLLGVCREAGWRAPRGSAESRGRAGMMEKPAGWLQPGSDAGRKEVSKGFASEVGGQRVWEPSGGISQ